MITVIQRLQAMRHMPEYDPWSIGDASVTKATYTVDGKKLYARVYEDYYLNNADYQGNPTYTKEEWKELQQTCSGLGIHMMTEIDLPGHSLLYNKYADENPDGIDNAAKEFTEKTSK